MAILQFCNPAILQCCCLSQTAMVSHATTV